MESYSVLIIIAVLLFSVFWHTGILRALVTVPSMITLAIKTKGHKML
jgi:hypothetical protein